MSLALAKEVLTVEAEAILRMRDRLDQDFLRAVELVIACKGRIVWTGMGKSGIICRKLAATMASTGTPALFLHPAEAIHGDLGMVTSEDLVVAISHSGETEEIVRLVELLKRLGVQLLGISSNPNSTLARHADVHLCLWVDREACPHNLAPTASTTAALALGDALAMAVSVRKGFSPEDFARLHPGGRLGKRLLTVRDLMHTGEQVPRVLPTTPMKDVIYEMSRKGLGITTVQDEKGRLLGVITDGDLRRLMERHPNPLSLKAAEAMHPGGVAIPPDHLATEALRLLEAKRITSVIVTDQENCVLGVVHLHDLWGVGLF